MSLTKKSDEYNVKEDTQKILRRVKLKPHFHRGIFRPTSTGMFRPCADMSSIIMIGTCLLCSHSGWELETSFKLVYFEFVCLLYI